MKISVIVPIYHGKMYIQQMIKQIEAAAKEVDSEVELLLVNDDPQEVLDTNLSSSLIEIHVYNTEHNCGIHGARVKGLERSEGELVLFFDQDDKMCPGYFKSQMDQIGSADAVACQLLDNNKVYYNKNLPLESCVQKEYMIYKGNFIVSPGQVLIRKSAIPPVWTSNILIHNGADDWLLWLCMLCLGKKFAVNSQVLFEHVIHKENASGNSLAMLTSMEEVYEILKESRNCTQEELNGINGIVKEHEKRFIRERDKYFRMYTLMDTWLTMREQGKKLSFYIKKHNCRRVSVYGKGRIGMRAARELTEDGIEVGCFITTYPEKQVCDSFFQADKKDEFLEEGIRTITLEDFKAVNEPVIITLIRDESKEIKKALEEKGVRQIYFIEDMLERQKDAEKEN